MVPCVCTQVRNLKKKLQQIEALEARQEETNLDPQQQAKLAQKAEVCASLAALHSGASLEEAHKIAQAHKPTSMAATLGSLVRRSPSTLSIDSSTSKAKSSTGKHRPAASRLASRQDLSKSLPTQAWDAGSSSMPADIQPPAPQQSPKDTMELGSHSPGSLLDRPAQSCVPAPQLSTPGPTSHPEAAGPSAAASFGSRPSAWGHAHTGLPAASLRVSGFSTPDRQKVEAPVWGTPVSGPPLSFGSAGGTCTPSSALSAAAKKVKPPRKGGLSMFLSGEPSMALHCCLSLGKA